MFITIYEALDLDYFKDFKLLAGKKGLNNKIVKVGILDHETNDMIEKSFKENEFVLSTLLIIKDKVEKLYEFVEKLINVKASGLAIKNIYFNEIPKEVVELANKNSFPIFLFSEVYFEDIITGIADCIKEKNEKNILALKIDNILYSNLNKVLIKKIAYEINREFKEKNIVVYCKRKNGSTTNQEIKDDTHKNNRIIQYNDGYLIINTFENVNKDEIDNIIINKLNILGFNTDEYYIGISSLYEKLDELNFSINESLYSFKNATITNEISFFNKIGTNKILLPLSDNIWIKKYHDEMISPLIDYDRENDTELLKTAIKYFGNNGDIKKTSAELFQHSNTIRYRIDKIYKILNKNNDIINFYEELSIGIRIHKILSMSL